MPVDAEIITGPGKQGYAARIVSTDRLADLREDIDAGRRQGLHDDDLYREYLGGFVFGPPAELRNAESIIVMAVRQLPVRFTFHRNGEDIPVPPTYLHAREIDLEAQKMLVRLLTPARYRVAPAVLPKNMAVLLPSAKQ